ncbi:MAG: hypothetical protein RDU14_05255 [Melioribacteraceae bacterium]|nr:hypothetical protein [Melioribacteraceae bacterium]
MKIYFSGKVLFMFLSIFSSNLLAQETNNIKSYYSYKYIGLSVGYFLTDQREVKEQLTFNNQKVLYNINFRLVDLPVSGSNPKIGLLNEFGIINTMAYLKMGALGFIEPGFSTELYIGLGIIFNKTSIIKPHSGALFVGVCPQYKISLNSSMNLELKFNLDSNLEDKFSISTFLACGFSLKVN